MAHDATASFIGTDVLCRYSSSCCSPASTASASWAPVLPALHRGTSFARASFTRIPEHRSAAVSSSCCSTWRLDRGTQSQSNTQRNRENWWLDYCGASEGSRQTYGFIIKESALRIRTKMFLLLQAMRKVRSPCTHVSVSTCVCGTPVRCVSHLEY